MPHGRGAAHGWSERVGPSGPGVSRESEPGVCSILPLRTRRGSSRGEVHDLQAKLLSWTARASSCGAKGGAKIGLLVVLLLSIGWESLFLTRGSNVTDEGWPLYAAMQLEAGRTLYEDVLWVFPPGHLLSAYVAHAVAPPGVFGARLGYAIFTVALVGALYVLGCRLVGPGWALLAASLVAVAAPRTHMMQVIFGYRYMVLAILALLAFDRRVRTGDRRWLVVAGSVAGVTLYFRVDTAFAACAAIGIATIALDSDPKRWAREVGLLLAGFTATVVPLMAWAGVGVGLATYWREVLVHPVAMLQPLPLPPLEWPESINRGAIARFWVAFSFRFYTVLYLGYAVWLVTAWIRDWRSGVRFRDPLLLGVIVLGGVFYWRAFGRSDEAHLDSVIPPACLLLVVLVARAWGWLADRLRLVGIRRAGGATVLAAALFASWVYLAGSDRQLLPERLARQGLPDRVLDAVEAIREVTESEDTILDMTAAPLFYVLAERLGPGYADIIMPGTFLNDGDETRFVALLEESPPAAVLWPLAPFDDMRERAVDRTAPRVAAWVQRRYMLERRTEKFLLLVPRS